MYADVRTAHALAVQAAKSTPTWDFEDFCIEVRERVEQEARRLMRTPAALVLHSVDSIMQGFDALDMQEIYGYRPD